MFDARIDYQPTDPSQESLTGSSHYDVALSASATTAQVVALTIDLDGADGSEATVTNTLVASVNPDGSIVLDSASAGAWSCGTSASPPTGGATASSVGLPAAPVVARLNALAAAVNASTVDKGTVKDLVRSLTTAATEYGKGKTKQALHALDEFIHHAQKSAPAGSNWVVEAQTIASLL
jgi:hypothetical protein